MNDSKQLCATSSIKWIVILVLTLLISGYYMWDDGSVSSITCISTLAFLVILIPVTVYHLINTTYLTSDGIEKRRLGHVIHRLSWCDISQICIIHDFPLSAKSSSTTHIIITPEDCVKFSETTYFGLQYMFIFRNKVIRIDDTKENRLFIESHYGEIVDLRKT